MPIEIKVTEDKRVDKYVKERLSYASLSEIFKLFRKGNVKLDKKKVDGNERALPGSTILIYVDETALKESSQKRVEERTDALTKSSLTILSEDKQLLVVNKPSGIAVHDGKGVAKGTSLIDLANHYGKQATPPFVPHLVHRLDAETSGVLLLTKNDSYLKLMIDVFKGGKISKTYRALCYGYFKDRSGTIRESLERNSSESRGMIMQVSKAGKEAHSEYRVLEQYNGAALVEVKIFTGRTHQIRAHMTHIGHPLIGDSRYGNPEKDAELQKRIVQPLRVALHAYEIGFPLPPSGKKVTFTAEVPLLFKELKKLFR